MSRISTFLYASLLCGCLALSASAGDNLSDIQDLDNDFSRTDLFAVMVQHDLFYDPKLFDGVEQFSLMGPFRFPNDAIFDAVENKNRENSIFGLDISHYTASNFPIKSLPQRAVTYLAMKASQGDASKDGKFAQFWAEAGKYKLHRGAYHFLSAGRDAKRQAELFLRIVHANGGLKPTDLPPIVDLEWDKASAEGNDRWQSLTPNEILAKLKTWLDFVEKDTGRKPMIYTARSWWRDRGIPDKRIEELAGYPIWIADYSNSSRGVEIPKVPNNHPYVLWQFTDRAKLASGFAPGFDANIFKGTTEEFYSKLGVAKF